MYTNDSTYQIIAPYYNWIMDHVDYQYWGDYLKKILVCHQIAPKKVLELAAGTCPFVQFPFFKEDVSITYTDLSTSMLIEGKKYNSIKNYESKKSNYVTTDAVSLPFKQSFDCILMIYDSINYLITDLDINQCFKEVHRVLYPNGVFVFDITTEFNSKTHFKDIVQYEERKDVTIIRDSWYEEDYKIQTNMFTYFIEKEKGLYQKLEEGHTQRIYTHTEIQEKAKKYGFKILKSYSNYTLEEPSNISERIHYILQKI